MTKERVYVKVSSDFDSTGYMQPTSITWSDGRTFPIETVRDFRPAGTADNGYSGDCFTVLIQGQEKADPSKVSMAKYSMLPARSRHIIIPGCRCQIALKSSLLLPPCEAMRMRLLLKAEIISKETESSCLKKASKL